MAQPYIGEIRITGFNFAPVGWAFCNGALLSIADYDTLYSLIGTTYGGDGLETFALPDLRGRTPLAPGPGFSIGQQAGEEGIILSENQMPPHTHLAVGTTYYGNTTSPRRHYPAKLVETDAYGPSADSTFAANTVHLVGENHPHNNMQPFLVVNYIISLFGIFPSQT